MAAVEMLMIDPPWLPAAWQFPHGRNGPEHVGVELAVELVFGDGLQRLEGVGAGVVNQNAHRAEGVGGLVE